MSPVIAIDGPMASGKGTAAQDRGELRLPSDTGLTYRA